MYDTFEIITDALKYKSYLDNFNQSNLHFVLSPMFGRMSLMFI